MKMFTKVLLILILTLPLAAGGQKEMDKAPMDNGMMEKEASGDSHTAPEGSMMMATSPVSDYMGMEDAMMLAEEKPTVLFFYATWCPTCQAAMKEIEADPHRLDGINLLIVDYDNSDDLQKKYGVTYQHTFVRIAPDGSALDKWNGGAVEDILMHTGLEEI